MKTNKLVLALIFACLQACGQNRNRQVPQQRATHAQGFVLSLQQKQTMINDYAGWLALFNNTYPAFINTCVQTIQMSQQVLQQGHQINQQMQQMTGMSVPRNYQQDIQMNNAIQQEKYKYQLLSYQYQYVKAQNQILQQLYTQANDQLFSIATAYHAFLMYTNFAYGYKEPIFEKALPNALRWYFSPQATYDIQATIQAMRAQNQIFRNQQIPNITSGSNYVNDDKHVERFTDVILGRKTWIDPDNGERYKMDIGIENPTINGQSMREY